MSEQEKLQSTQSLDDWLKINQNKTWYDIMTQKHDELSTAYIDIIAEFASQLQVFLAKISPSQPEPKRLNHYMRNLKEKIPEIFDWVLLNVNSEPLPDDEIDLEQAEEIACNLFSRVMNIFQIHNRSMNSLYQDMDINKDGKINFEELRTEFFKYDPSITVEESKTVFDILDGNKDGSISLQELKKRMKFIKERAEQERVDPLSCLVISKPLDPNKINANLSVMLIRGELLSAGAHSVKIKIPELLEYLAPDSTDCNPYWNFRADFFFENKSEKELPLFIDVELYNKSKLEGIGSFQWKKAMNTPNDFSLKTKVTIKTSTGQLRGNLYFQVMWTPILVRIYTDAEIKKMKALEAKLVERHQNESSLIKGRSLENFDFEDDLYDVNLDDDINFDEISLISPDKKPWVEGSDSDSLSGEEDNTVGELEDNKIPISFSFNQKAKQIQIGKCKLTPEQLHFKTRSYTYITKPSEITMEKVMEKKIKPVNAQHKTFNVVITKKKTITSPKAWNRDTNSYAKFKPINKKNSLNS